MVGFLDHDANRAGQHLINPGIIETYDQLFEVVERYRVQAIVVCMEDR